MAGSGVMFLFEYFCYLFSCTYLILTHTIIFNSPTCYLYFLFLTNRKIEKGDPFLRKIHPEELWLYKNPITPSYVPSELLWVIVVFIPLGVICLFFFFKHDVADLTQAILSLTYALVLNGNITTVIKLVVGKSREG